MLVEGPWFEIGWIWAQGGRLRVRVMSAEYHHEACVESVAVFPGKAVHDGVLALAMARRWIVGRVTAVADVYRSDNSENEASRGKVHRCSRERRCRSPARRGQFLSYIKAARVSLRARSSAKTSRIDQDLCGWTRPNRPPARPKLALHCHRIRQKRLIRISHEC